MTNTGSNTASTSSPLQAGVADSFSAILHDQRKLARQLLHDQRDRIRAAQFELAEDIQSTLVQLEKQKQAVDAQAALQQDLAEELALRRDELDRREVELERVRVKWENRRDEHEQLTAKLLDKIQTQVTVLSSAQAEKQKKATDAQLARQKELADELTAKRGELERREAEIERVRAKWENRRDEQGKLTVELLGKIQTQITEISTTQSTQVELQKSSAVDQSNRHEELVKELVTRLAEIDRREVELERGRAKRENRRDEQAKLTVELLDKIQRQLTEHPSPPIEKQKNVTNEHSVRHEELAKELTKRLSEMDRREAELERARAKWENRRDEQGKLTVELLGKIQTQMAQLSTPQIEAAPKLSADQSARHEELAEILAARLAEMDRREVELERFRANWESNRDELGQLTVELLEKLQTQVAELSSAQFEQQINSAEDQSARQKEMVAELAAKKAELERREAELERVRTKWESRQLEQSQLTTEFLGKIETHVSRLSSLQLEQQKQVADEQSARQKELVEELSQRLADLDQREAELERVRTSWESRRDEHEQLTVDLFDKIQTQIIELASQAQRNAESMVPSSRSTTAVEESVSRPTPQSGSPSGLRQTGTRGDSAGSSSPPSHAKSPSTNSPSSGSLDWESLKRRLISQMESEGDESASPVVSQDRDETSEYRDQIADIIARTDEIVAEKDRQIQELESLLRDQSANLADVAVGASAIANLIDHDAIVNEERESLRKLQEEWQSKLSRAELEISIERAKIARDRVALEERIRQLESERAAIQPPSKDAKGNPGQKGRWLARLGLIDDGEAKK